MTVKLRRPGRSPAVVLVFILGCSPSESRGPGPAAPSPKAAPPATASTDANAAPPAAPAQAAPPPESAPRRLPGWFASTRELAEAVLTGLREKDSELLDSLRVTEREYKDILFPEFPAATGNAPPDFHWFLLNTESAAGIERALGTWGAQDFELADVVVTKGTQEYRTYQILSKVELKVRDRKGGPEVRQLRIFGSVVELNGGYKILSFKN